MEYRRYYQRSEDRIRLGRRQARLFIEPPSQDRHERADHEGDESRPRNPRSPLSGGMASEFLAYQVGEQLLQFADHQGAASPADEGEIGALVQERVLEERPGEREARFRAVAHGGSRALMAGQFEAEIP